MRQSFSVGIGGAAGQGVATPGDIFAKIFSRRGLHLNAYNAYQSIIRGGHTFLTVRTGPDKIATTDGRLDLLVPLNQDTMDRHMRLLSAGSACLYNADLISRVIRPREYSFVPSRFQSWPISVVTRSPKTPLRLAQA